MELKLSNVALAANAALVLIGVACSLLARQIEDQARVFENEGGFTERLHHVWTERHARAQLRVLVKRILRKYGYSPDKQAKATETVLEQARALCNEWAIA